jgi:hypothetical protein
VNICPCIFLVVAPNYILIRCSNFKGQNTKLITEEVEEEGEVVEGEKMIKKNYIHPSGYTGKENAQKKKEMFWEKCA